MSHESDINYLIGGLVLGGALAAPVGFLLSQADLGVRLGIGAVGCFAGIGFGYWRAWAAKQSRRKRIARTIEKQISQAPPTMPTQIAGKTCSGCESQIVFVSDGSFCKICFDPFCLSCKDLPAICAACTEKRTQ